MGEKNRIFVFLIILLFVVSITANIGFAKDDKDKDSDKIRDILEQDVEELKRSGLGGEKIPVIITIDNADIQDIRNTIKSLNGKIMYEYDIVDAVAAFVPAKNVELLANYDYVSFIDTDAEAHILAQTTPWGISRVNAPSAWVTTTGLGADVAVLDTGIDPLHQDLAQNIEFGIAFDRGRVSTIQGDWADENGHGTHVAGTIAAVNNAIGVVGVAHSTGLYAVRVLDEGGRGFISDVIAGVDWSVKGSDNIIGTADDAEVVSMSLGTSVDIVEFKNAVDNAYAQGVVVVAAAGNSGDGNPLTQEISYPAAYSSVIAVGATDINNVAPFWSNSGNYLELAAPGVSVFSTYLDNTYATLSGTSMATPHVSGTVALMRAANPLLTPAQVRAALQSTATDLGPIGWDTVYGYGLVNALAAVSAVTVPDTTPPVISSITTTSTSNSATITWVTNEPADSRVDFGLTIAYGSFVSNPNLVTSHSSTLTGLSPSTLYHFKVTSVDAASNSASSVDLTFTTAAPPTLVSISVTPVNLSILVGSTQQFKATGTYSDGTTADLTNTVAWASSNTAVATISATGLAAALSAGTTVITATSGAVVGGTTLTVTTQPKDVVTITLAQYNLGKRELRVQATSTNPAATLTVVGYGVMQNKGGGNYWFRAKNVPDPGATITVTSSSGGSATAPVQHLVKNKEEVSE